MVDVTRLDASTSGGGWSLATADYALALLELSLGNYEAAWAGWPVDWERDVYLSMFGAADGVEAAARAGQPAAASAIVERYQSRVQAAQTPVAMGLLARAQALITTGGSAEPALSGLDRTAGPGDRHRRGGPVAFGVRGVAATG